MNGASFLTEDDNEQDKNVTERHCRIRVKRFWHDEAMIRVPLRRRVYHWVPYDEAR